jgi:hypothetical protein
MFELFSIAAFKLGLNDLETSFRAPRLRKQVNRVVTTTDEFILEVLRIDPIRFPTWSFMGIDGAIPGVGGSKLFDGPRQKFCRFAHSAESARKNPGLCQRREPEPV